MTARAPKHLSPAMRRWWGEVERAYDLDAHHRLLLQSACESWDQQQRARAKLDADGEYSVNRYGSVVPHPAVKVERDARLDFARIVRQLDLDGETDPAFRRRV